MMMLAFDMETKRINEIINIGAKTALSDLQFLAKEISKFIKSPERSLMMTGDMYYDYEQAIKNKKRMVLGGTGMVEDKNLPNNRFVDNQYGAMVDQKVNYLLAKPVTFKTGNQAYANALSQVFNKRFMKTLKNMGKDAYNGGIAWLYPFYDEHGTFRFRKFHPWEILPFWKDDDHTELDFIARVYDMWTYEGPEEKLVTYVDVYDTRGIHHFVRAGEDIIPDYTVNYFELQEGEEYTPYNWERVPFIAFKANNNETPLIKKCKGLQDGINQILSNFGDGMEENASGNTILVIHNYGGTDLGEFRHNLMQYKAVKVETVDGSDGGIDALKVEVNCENYKTLLAELRKALIQNCRGYDVEELKSNGSPNEMTIKAIFSAIDLDANELESEFQSSFEDLMWFVNAYLKNAGKGDFASEQLDVIFDRDLMINESQIITDCQNSTGIISHKTIVANHPWVTDPEDEWDQIQKEQEEEMGGSGYDFGNNNKKKKLEDDESDGDEGDEE